VNPLNFLNKLFFYKQNKLVYLHIEKSAGTSQRTFFYENLNKEVIFWYDIDSKSKNFILKEVKNKTILGGHRFFDFYNNPKYIYLTVLRDPIESTLSLFNFFITQQHHIDNWNNKQGFDPKSFENTLKNCTNFRNRIQNAQCRYFGKTKTFNEAKQTIIKYKFMVGSLVNLDYFNKNLIESMKLSNQHFPKVNTGKPGYQSAFRISQNSLIDLKGLLDQDMLLYDFILTNHNGLYSNVTQKDWDKLNI